MIVINAIIKYDGIRVQAKINDNKLVSILKIQ